MDERGMTPSNGMNLAMRNELYESMPYYGVMPRIVIEYISDIHLLHHRRYFGGDIDRTVKAMSKSLYESLRVLREGISFSGAKRPLWDTPIFLGDVASDKDVVVAFYEQYYKQHRLNALYRQYKQFRREQDSILALEEKRVDAKRRSENLARYIATKNAEFERMKSIIDKHISYSKVIAPKGNRKNIERYLRSDYYKKRKLPRSLRQKILAAAALGDEISKLKRSKQKQDSIITAVTSKKAVGLCDFKPCGIEYRPDGPIGVVILGNHEYADFVDVDEAVDFYKRALEPLKYIVLQNEYVEGDNVVIYGGTGFAKYSDYFNANNLVCCEAMMGNRAYEIEQTSLFEKGYEAARIHAKKTAKCFICASHYPVENCLGRCDREAIYFTGHTHVNERVRTEEKTLYADNQVGYHNDGKFDGAIRFKQATTDSVINPYDCFKDGYYRTTPDEYLRFCDYIGDYVGEGKLIRERCLTGELYAIKSRGYYGFFVVNNSGISIVNGGKTKRIAQSKNLKWIYDNFNIVVNRYLKALEPLRMTQEQISRELKRLGFSGNIHGLIVDIDYLNHVMVNPISGSISFYYSPVWGKKRQFGSFQKQLEFMNDMGLLDGKGVSSESAALAAYGANTLASVENNDILDEMVVVSRTMGVYGVSRAVNPLQKLFTGHVLRSFDLRLIEIGDENATVGRTRSLRGRVYRIFRERDYDEFLVINDDLGEFVTLLSRDGRESKATVLELRALTRSDKGKWMTKSLDETLVRYGGRYLPKSWREPIRYIQPKMIEEKKLVD